MMQPMSNPVAMLMQCMRTGQNPMQLLQQQAGSNPQLQTLQKICQGKSPQELMQVADNMCRERGTTYQELAQRVAQQYGIPLK